jgi:integrase
VQEFAMPRKPQVRYFASRKAFYCQYQGKQHRLGDGPDDSPTGPNYLAALEAFKQLLSLGAVGRAKDRNTVRVVLETYLQHKEGKMKDSTLRRRLFVFRPFCAVHGETAVGDLTHLAVYQFIESMRQPRKVKKRRYAWGDPAVALFLEALGAAFNWAVRGNIISVNPIANIERPRVRSRSRDCILTSQQHQHILTECRSQTTRNIVIALENTGARPGELTAATAADWDDGLGAIVYYGDDRRRQDEFRHKTAGKLKDRVINFTGEALTMMRELVKKHQEGPLFRTNRGGGYAEKSVVQCFRALRERLKMPKLTPYSYRHTFATRWLLSGRSIDVLAELLGNSPNTIRKHYAHLCADRASIRRQLEDFKQEAETEKTTRGSEQARTLSQEAGPLQTTPTDGAKSERRRGRPQRSE